MTILAPDHCLFIYFTVDAVSLCFTLKVQRFANFITNNSCFVLPNKNRVIHFIS